MFYKTILLFRKRKSVKVILGWGLKICISSVHARQVWQITVLEVLVVIKVTLLIIEK